MSYVEFTPRSRWQDAKFASTTGSGQGAKFASTTANSAKEQAGQGANFEYRLGRVLPKLQLSQVQDLAEHGNESTLFRSRMQSLNRERTA